MSNQLEAGSTIVRHIKSISVLSLPLRVYGPMRSTHNASQGFVMTNLGAVFALVTTNFFTQFPDSEA